MKKLQLTLCASLLLCFSYTYAAAPVPGDDKVPASEKWIPADIDLEHITLLVQKRTNWVKKGKDSYAKENEALKKIMDENYPYPYEFAEFATEHRWDDKNKYAYMLFFGSNTDNYNTSSGAHKSTNGCTIFMIDRKTVKETGSNGWSYGFRKDILQATIKQLVKVYQARKSKKQ